MADQAECKFCAEKIQWAVTAKGRRMPLDLIPVNAEQHGAQVTFMAAGQLQCRPLDAAIDELALRRAISRQQARVLIDTTLDAYVSHFATCTNYGHRR